MDLKFILSLNFDQVSLKEEQCLGIGVFLNGRKFNVVDGQVDSGIFKHKRNKKLFLVLYEDFIFIGLLGSNGFGKYVELRITMVCYDKSMYQKIVKMVVKEYVKNLKQGRENSYSAWLKYLTSSRRSKQKQRNDKKNFSSYFVRGQLKN